MISPINMLFAASLVPLFCTLLVSAQLDDAPDTLIAGATPHQTCNSIAQKISSASQILSPLNIAEYQDALKHWYLTSSQAPACVLEAGSAADVAAALKIISANKTPFAVKSGGHTSNPGFSSTTGVHIIFGGNLKKVKVSRDRSTVEIGMGLTWYDVYQQIESTGVNVVGGRTTGPGVGGFTLGGGYSWKTNQFGLTCDSVKSYNLVLPNSTIVKVDSSKPDLFFALKGGLNRFGIVTSAVYYTHKQSPKIYGGIAVYDPSQLSKVVKATSDFFAQNKDPKAQIITTINGAVTGASPLVLFFNDGPNKPNAFKLFDGIPSILNAVKQQTFAQFVGSIPSSVVINARGTFNTISTTKITPRLAQAIANESTYWGKQMLAHSGTFISYDVEPFDTSYGKHATESAYPHSDSPLPLNLYFAWISPLDDAFWYNALKQSIATIKRVAISEGIYKNTFTRYPNYAISNTTAVDLYGATNANRLRRIKKSVDPKNIMGLAGGFSI